MFVTVGAPVWWDPCDHQHSDNPESVRRGRASDWEILFLRISMENKWKCAELGAHSVQAPCSQSKAAVLFCTIQLEWGDRLRHQLSYLQWGGRALCLKKGRRSQSRAGHARPSSLHIMSLFRNIHEEIPCLYFNFFQFYWEVIDIPIEARGDRVMISFIHGVKWWPH